MTHAYSGSYLNNAKDRLSSFFDYAINDCKLKPDWITALFINTGYAEQFERGNPAYVADLNKNQNDCLPEGGPVQRGILNHQARQRRCRSHWQQGQR